MMKNIKQQIIVGLVFVGIAIPLLSSSLFAHNDHNDHNYQFTGSVEQVWEDGFSLNTGDRTLEVDASDVYGDNTRENVAVGDQVTVIGEFDDGEFDADSISK